MSSEKHTQLHLRFDARGVSAGSVGGKGQQERMGVEPPTREDEIPWPTRLVRTAGLLAGASSGEPNRRPMTRTQRRRVPEGHGAPAAAGLAADSPGVLRSSLRRLPPSQPRGPSEPRSAASRCDDSGSERRHGPGQCGVRDLAWQGRRVIPGADGRDLAGWSPAACSAAACASHRSRGAAAAFRSVRARCAPDFVTQFVATSVRPACLPHFFFVASILEPFLVSLVAPSPPPPPPPPPLLPPLPPPSSSTPSSSTPCAPSHPPPRRLPGALLRVIICCTHPSRSTCDEPPPVACRRGCHGLDSPGSGSFFVSK
ncbi:unnamed protein product [Prorocentrum cordatum]|uniref:Uncharacterized protein n=1 Tax=Prorocentrum cordatum TaxID=2364126 RepID=A0ABN9PHU3_9DINO|nr:unnamed protein product [Polarella glacialis]